jgi:hypothetical protein
MAYVTVFAKSTTKSTISNRGRLTVQPAARRRYHPISDFKPRIDLLVAID